MLGERKVCYTGGMKRVVMAFVGVVIGVMMLGGVAFADDDNGSKTDTTQSGGGGCNTTFIGLRPWYAGLAEGKDCEIKPIECPEDGKDCPAMTAFIWGIVTNLLYDMFVIVGYLAIGFLMFGGYTYLLARGDPGRIEKGKKTIIGAVSGLIIAVVASFIVSFIGNVILEGI